MFQSRSHPRIFTQYEHGRLSGTIARAWGNDAFARPPLPFEPFVEGVMLHDWGYGVVDNTPIGEASEKEWLVIMQRGADIHYGHPVTDVIIKRHLRRLLLLDPTPARRSLAESLKKQIDDRTAASGIAPVAFDRADLITRFCDRISFDFCFEQPTRQQLPVFAQPDAADPVLVSYEIRPDGEVTLDPWPLGVPMITSSVYAFAHPPFPDSLEPITVPFTLRPG